MKGTRKLSDLQYFFEYFLLSIFIFPSFVESYYLTNPIISQDCLYFVASRRVPSVIFTSLICFSVVSILPYVPINVLFHILYIYIFLKLIFNYIYGFEFLFLFHLVNFLCLLCLFIFLGQ